MNVSQDEPGAGEGLAYLDALVVQTQTKADPTVECFADIDAVRPLVPRSALHPSTLVYNPRFMAAQRTRFKEGSKKRTAPQ